MCVPVVAELMSGQHSHSLRQFLFLSLVSLCWARVHKADRDVQTEEQDVVHVRR